MRDIDGTEYLMHNPAVVNADGEPREPTIRGMTIRRATPVAHRHGYTTEIARMSWDALAQPIVQVHTMAYFANEIADWRLHYHTTDRLFVARGSMRLVCFDGRGDSPTRGNVSEVYAGERAPLLVTIPNGVYHALQNLGQDEALVVSLPTQEYDFDHPDSHILRWDDPATEALIPFRW